MKKLAILLLSLALPASAQEGPDLLTWIRDHSSVVSGVATADGEHVEFISLALKTDFEVKPKFRGFAELNLFSRQRSGESIQTPGVPMSLQDLAIYSAGEAVAGAYYEWTPKVGFECRGGVNFAMIALTGTHGEPVDPSKFLGACGLRLTGGPGRLSVLGGHSGPVDAGAKLFGFIPSMVFNGEFRLSGGVSFVLDISAGRDLTTDKSITTSRFSVRKGF
jgi:hypothetical protein